MSTTLGPLHLDQFTRDVWGQFDAQAIAQLDPLYLEPCYQPKFYKIPDPQSEVVAAFGYVATGLKITPGSLIYGIYLPAALATPSLFNLQITDQNMKTDPSGRLHSFCDEPVPSFAVSNFKPTSLSLFLTQYGSFPYLFNCPHPVVGDGLFLVEIWETSGVQQRIEVVLGVLEVVK